MLVVFDQTSPFLADRAGRKILAEFEARNELLPCSGGPEALRKLLDRWGARADDEVVSIGSAALTGAIAGAAILCGHAGALWHVGGAGPDAWTGALNLPVTASARARLASGKRAPITREVRPLRVDLSSQSEPVFGATVGLGKAARALDVAFDAEGPFKSTLVRLAGRRPAAMATGADSDCRLADGTVLPGNFVLACLGTSLGVGPEVLHRAVSRELAVLSGPVEAEGLEAIVRGLGKLLRATGTSSLETETRGSFSIDGWRYPLVDPATLHISLAAPVPFAIGRPA